MYSLMQQPCALSEDLLLLLTVQPAVRVCISLLLVGIAHCLDDFSQEPS